MKLLIAIPAMDYVHVEFVRSLLALKDELAASSLVQKLEISIESGTLVYIARDKLARKAVREGFTHVLWIDSDMVFTPGIVEDLLFCGAPVVSGIAVSRRQPFGSCLFSSLHPVERINDFPHEAFEVAACGFACVLTAVEALKEVLRVNNTCFTPTPTFGEDVAFCERATALGFKIMAEPSVRLGHIGHLIIYPDNAARYRDEIH